MTNKFLNINSPQVIILKPNPPPLHNFQETTASEELSGSLVSDFVDATRLVRCGMLASLLVVSLYIFAAIRPPLG